MTSTTNEAAQAAVRSLLESFIENAIAKSEENPQNIAENIKHDLIQNVFRESDTENIVEEILDNISKISVAENNILAGAVPSKESLEEALDYSPLENEVKSYLEEIVLKAFKESKVSTTENIIEEEVEKSVSNSESINYQKHMSHLGEKGKLPENRVKCLSFMGPETISEDVVDEVIKSSQDVIHNNIESALKLCSRLLLTGEEEVGKVNSSLSKDMPLVEIFEKPFGLEVEWPKISEFTVTLGKVKINEFVSNWYYYEEWLYCIKHLGAQSDDVSDFYVYEVIWSIPTPFYPIPQATASVFFTISASRIMPQDCAVQVTYQFEGSRFVHKPGTIEFQEDWLFNIIDAKINLFKMVTF